MKKLILSMAIIALAVIACEEQNEMVPTQETVTVDMSDFFIPTAADLAEKSSDKSSEDRCHSMQVLSRQLAQNPGLYNRMYNIEKHTRTQIAKGKPTNPGGGNGGGDSGDGDVDVDPIEDGLGTINIPVYIHIVYPDATTNSSWDAQVSSQMATLNEDFRNLNTESLPSGTTFENDRTDAGFSFSLSGVFKHNDSKAQWGTNDAVKAAYPPVTPETHMNIWVCNIGGGILGYAQFPGGPLATDGIVLGGNYFGDTSGVYGMGRTATHEVGHYLNLRHIWGDGRCRQDDFVEDTPRSDRSNGGCPPYPTVHCKTPDMTMNYMDYTYDACMYMFTDGQRNRMRALFAPNGARSSMLP